MDNIITNCTRDEVIEMSQHRAEGWSYIRISKKFGYGNELVARYIRLLNLYGPRHFIAKREQG
jgi:hypothetical protein